MNGDERQRFCSHCQLHVYNFSAMTKAEVEGLLRNAEGRVCGRFYQRADGTMLTQDCPVGLRAVRRRISRVAATAFAMVCGLITGQGSYAQQKQDEGKASVQRSLRRYEQPAIQGTVYDQARAVIGGVWVKVINQQTKKVINAQSDGVGRFRFVDLTAGEYNLEVDSPGFIKLSVTNLVLTDGEAITLDATMKVNDEALMGVVVEATPKLVPTNDTVLPTKLVPKSKPK
jgi:hypothetical protein